MAHENFKALATKLISKNGRKCYLVSFIDSGDAWNPIREETETEIIALQSKFKISEVDGDLIGRDDILELIDSSIIPDKNMRFIDGDVTYEIKNVERLKPSDTAIMYKLQLKGGSEVYVIYDSVGWNDIDSVGWDSKNAIGWSK